MNKTAARIHYYLPGALGGAILGSQVKDTNPATGQEEFSSANAIIGAGAGALAGHIVGTKLPQAILKKELLAREGATSEKFKQILTGSLDNITKNAPKNPHNYYQNNLNVGPLKPSRIEKSVDKVNDTIKEHTNILGRRLDFMTPDEVKGYAASELSGVSIKPVIEQALNKQFQGLSKEMLSGYAKDMRDLSSTVPKSFFGGIKDRFARRSAKVDARNYINKVKKTLPDISREAVYS
jgi:hypothetical protein